MGGLSNSSRTPGSFLAARAPAGGDGDGDDVAAEDVGHGRGVVVAAGGGRVLLSLGRERVWGGDEQSFFF